VNYTLKSSDFVFHPYCTSNESKSADVILNFNNYLCVLINIWVFNIIHSVALIGS